MREELSAPRVLIITTPFWECMRLSAIPHDNHEYHKTHVVTVNLTMRQYHSQNATDRLGFLRLMRHILGLYSIEPSLTWENGDPLGGSASVVWRYMPSEICTKYLGSRSAALISILQCSACNRYHSVVSRCKSCPISFILHIMGLFWYTEHKPSSFSLEQEPSGLIS